MVKRLVVVASQSTFVTQPIQHLDLVSLRLGVLQGEVEKLNCIPVRVDTTGARSGYDRAL